MCLYIFSPNHNIEIEYASESIYYYTSANCTVILDLLIKNLDDSPINEYYILYPNSFIDIASLEHKNTEDRSYLKEEVPKQFCNRAVNLTGTFLEDKNPYNTYYDDMDLGRSINKKSIKQDNNQGNEVTITLNDYNNPYNSLNLIGEIFDIDNELQLPPNLGLTSWISLNNRGYTIFYYKFKVPQLKNKSRFLRFKFEPNIVAYNEPKSKRHFLRYYLTNERYYHFDILGPYEVCDRLFERMKISENIDTSESKFKVGEILNIIYKKYNDLSEKNHKVIINRWLLNLFPMKLRTFIEFVPIGNIIPIGNLPNLLRENKIITVKHGKKPSKKNKKNEAFWKKRSYQWISKDDKAGKFRLIFSAKYHSYLYEYSPLILLEILIIYIMLSSDYESIKKMPGVIKILIYSIPFLPFLLPWLAGNFLNYIFKKVWTIFHKIFL